MRITILGKSPSWQDAGGACSGYLVEGDSTRLLVDCGSGVFARLREVTDYREVDAVVITHFHADHVLDLVPYAYAMTFSPLGPPPVRPELIVPAGGTELLHQLAGLWGPAEIIQDAFQIMEYEPQDVATAGEFTIRFQLVPHYVPTFALDIRAREDGPRFTFGADCAPNEELVEFATDTDFLLIEATLRVPEDDEPRGHLTATEAGEHARAAGARRVAITHITDELDQELSRRQAEEAFGGPVELAKSGAVIEL